MALHCAAPTLVAACCSSQLRSANSTYEGVYLLGTSICLVLILLLLVPTVQRQLHLRGCLPAGHFHCPPPHRQAPDRDRHGGGWVLASCRHVACVSPVGSALEEHMFISCQIEIALKAGGSGCAVGGWLTACVEGWMLPHTTRQIVIAWRCVCVCVLAMQHCADNPAQTLMQQRAGGGLPHSHPSR